jgi:pimeloyl-ACP methyl ester carboxylesterase
MPFADVNGIRMYYEDEGEGTPVVLITGFSGDTTFFKQLIPEVASKHRVIVFDNRGAGQTEYSGEAFGWQDMVDDVLALLDRLRLFRVHMLGWSMGGHIAQEFAIQHPERLMSLTLVSAYPYRPARSSYFMNGIVDCALRGGDPEYINMMTNAFCFTEDFFAGLEAKGKVLRSLKGLDPKGLKHQMQSLDGFDTRGKLESISVPTLSIHGLSDIMVEPKLGDYISDRIPGCRVLRIPDAGHIIKPALYQKEFLEHVASHDVQRASLQAGRRRSNPAFGKYSVCASVGQSNTNKR